MPDSLWHSFAHAVRAWPAGVVRKIEDGHAAASHTSPAELPAALCAGCRRARACHEPPAAGPTLLEPASVAKLARIPPPRDAPAEHFGLPSSLSPRSVC